MSSDYWTEIDRQAIAYLRLFLAPQHYRSLFSRIGLDHHFGLKTDPAEKFRQRYAEHEHANILLIPGGWLALRHWFPIRHSNALFAAFEPMYIPGLPEIAYEAGYEHRAREPYLKDWYHDGQTQARYERRKRAYLFEHTVRAYYQQNWPLFYMPPSNAGQYERPAEDDFKLKMPNGRSYIIDTKSKTTDFACFVRRAKKDVIYIVGDWDSGLGGAVLSGIAGGKNVEDRWLDEGRLSSAEILPVILNMAHMNMDYNEVYASIMMRQP